MEVRAVAKIRKDRVKKLSWECGEERSREFVVANLSSIGESWKDWGEIVSEEPGWFIFKRIYEVEETVQRYIDNAREFFEDMKENLFRKPVPPSEIIIVVRDLKE